MNRDNIIRMAQEAGLIPPPLDWPQKYAEALERFAALVASAEREACAELIPPQYFELRDRIRARGQA